MEKYTDSERLLKDLNNSDRDAQAFLYRLFYKKIAYYAYLQVNSASLARDIADRAFELLWTKDSNFDSLKAVQSFLYRSAFNNARNEKRHAAVVNAYGEKQFYTSFNDYQEDTLTKMIRAEFIDRIADEIDSLESGDQKDIIKLYFYEGFKTHEISRHLMLSEQTVRNYKAKALKILEIAIIRKGIFQPLFFYLLLHIL